VLALTGTRREHHDLLPASVGDVSTINISDKVNDVTTPQNPNPNAQDGLEYLRRRYASGAAPTSVAPPLPEAETSVPEGMNELPHSTQVDPLAALRGGTGRIDTVGSRVPAQWRSAAAPRTPEPEEPVLQSVSQTDIPTYAAGDAFTGNDDYRIRNKRDIPTQGFRRFLAETLRIPVGKSKTELEYDNLIALMNRSLLSPKVIGVIGGKGGVGKTTTAMCLASTLSEHRSKPVCAITLDYNSTLALRTKAITSPARGEVSILDFATDKTITTPNDIAGCMLNNKQRLSVLGVGLDAVQRDNLTPQQYQRALSMLKDNFELIVVDFGNVPSTEFYWAALQSLDAMVVVTSTENDSMQGTKLVESMAREAGLLDLLDRQTIVLINHRSPAEPKVDINHFVGRMQSARHREILDIPWDDHLSESGPVDLDLISKPVKYQFIRAAALAMSALPA